MNQILVTEKLYITPELKRKKKIYKFDFFLSILLICILASVYAYASYDRNKSEAVSQEILAEITPEDNTVVDDDVLVVYLDEGIEEEQITEAINQNQTITASNGKTYSPIATINIPAIGVNYPILSETSDELLKIAPCKFWGPEPNEVGNFCIVGHNYRSSKFFSKVPNLEKGETIDITDLSGRKFTYIIYDKYTVEPSNVACTSQLTNGKTEITLITCTNDNKERVIVKATKI